MTSESEKEFQQQCLRLWDLGKNTKEISQELMRPEHAVERALRFAREQRRQRSESEN